MAYYILNVVGDAWIVAGFLQAELWSVDAREPHRNALATGDLVLLYRGAPARAFAGRAVLASGARDWTSSEATRVPDDSAGGVLLTEIEAWVPPVPMSDVLAQIDRSQGARADFETGVVAITAGEYETALAVAARRAPPS